MLDAVQRAIDAADWGAVPQYNLNPLSSAEGRAHARAQARQQDDEVGRHQQVVVGQRRGAFERQHRADQPALIFVSTETDAELRFIQIRRDLQRQRHRPEAGLDHLDAAVELRAEPGPQAAVLSRVFCGTRLTVLETQGAWAKVAAHLTGWLPLADLRALDALPTTTADRRAQILADAGRLVGVPYLWGGTTGNGIDCSGYARLLHRWVGLEIPRDADLQSKQSQRIEPPYQPGDLFFFGEGDTPDRQITHVGVCLGGTQVVHSSRSRNGVYLDDLQENAFLREIFVHAGTFIGR